MIIINAEHTINITKICDDEELFIYVDDGNSFGVKRNSKFGAFINRYLRKEKLKKIDVRKNIF